jgi:hypothetical protein
VFPTRRGTPIERTEDWREWKIILKQAGVRDVRVHDTRHTAGTMLIEQGRQHPRRSGGPRTHSRDHHRALHARGRRPGPGRRQPDGRRPVGRGLTATETATGAVQPLKTIKGLPAIFIGKALISGRRLGDLNPGWTSSPNRISSLVKRPSANYRQGPATSASVQVRGHISDVAGP